MENKSVRLRFAPSPTGYLHVGGLRTALYNLFLAKKLKGKLILRVEDTDQNRLVENAEENLIEMLNWSGIAFDEGPHIGGEYGPYRQSERLLIYKKYYHQLITDGHAYPCFYSDERLENLKKGSLSSEDATIEDTIFKDFNIKNIFEKMKNESFIIRFKIPRNESLDYNDAVKGNIKFDLNLINDPIIIKTDGFPTYHFANVIDDYLMEITHVIRGDEWLPSIPKHIALYNAFNWSPPIFGHLPLLLNNDKSKLSKRKNDVSVDSYIKKGYTKESLINFLSLLGWHETGDRELYKLNELIDSFSLERVSKSGAIFDVLKLQSFNNHYIKSYSFNILKNKLNNFIPKHWQITEEMIDLVKDKANTLYDFTDLLEFIFINKISFTKNTINILKINNAISILILFKKHYKLGSIAKIASTIQNELEYPPKSIWQVIRLALTGQNHGPSLDQVTSILGSDKVEQRINEAIHQVEI